MKSIRKEKIENYLKKGYVIKVGVVYLSRSDLTIINEYVIDPNEEDEIDREIDHWYMFFYRGKPNDETTREKYRIMKETIYRESMEGIEILPWVSPLERFEASVLPELPEDENQTLEEIRAERAKMLSKLTPNEIIGRHLRIEIKWLDEDDIPGPEIPEGMSLDTEVPESEIPESEIPESEIPEGETLDVKVSELETIYQELPED